MTETAPPPRTAATHPKSLDPAEMQVFADVTEALQQLEEMHCDGMDYPAVMRAVAIEASERVGAHDAGVLREELEDTSRSERRDARALVLREHPDGAHVSLRTVNGGQGGLAGEVIACLPYRTTEEEARLICLALGFRLTAYV